MENEDVLGWYAILKKDVRTQDGRDASMVIGVCDDNLVVRDFPKKKFIVPKEDFERFDVSELYLNLTDEGSVRHEKRGIRALLRRMLKTYKTIAIAPASVPSPAPGNLEK